MSIKNYCISRSITYKPIILNTYGLFGIKSAAFLPAVAPLHRCSPGELTELPDPLHGGSATGGCSHSDFRGVTRLHRLSKWCGLWISTRKHQLKGMQKSKEQNISKTLLSFLLGGRVNGGIGMPNHFFWVGGTRIKITLLGDIRTWRKERKITCSSSSGGGGGPGLPTAIWSLKLRSKGRRMKRSGNSAYKI